ncbi:hypothetical protein Pta02_12450 [Planobispora takensis]|uniref:Uncharacterized protein n=1 Tax=Planobispora takensis TaxID=1367882 RepID=A0A8J3SRI8_9ACTN|nr:hypothetical protein Pta02_12450 [Planobispora takensis]
MESPGRTAIATGRSSCAISVKRGRAAGDAEGDPSDPEVEGPGVDPVAEGSLTDPAAEGGAAGPPAEQAASTAHSRAVPAPIRYEKILTVLTLQPPGSPPSMIPLPGGEGGGSGETAAPAGRDPAGRGRRSGA